MGLSTTIPSPDQFKKMQAGIAAIPAPQLGPVNMAGSPAMDAPAMPNVVMDRSTPSSPATPEAQVLRDQTKLSDLRTSGAGVAQIHNPFLRGLARTTDIVGSVFAPGLATAIPGTTLHHNLLLNQAQQNLANDQATQQRQQQVEDEKAQERQRQAQADKYDSQADSMAPIMLSVDQAKALGHPELAGTQTTMRDYARNLASAGHDSTSAANNTRTNDTRQSISDDRLEAAARAAAAKPEQRDDHYISIMAKPPGERTADDLAYKQGYEGYIKAKMTDPRVAGALARPLQVVLPSGQAGYMTAGQAIHSGAQGLGDNEYKAQGALLKDFTSGTDSHTLNAINTARGHVTQGLAAIDALNNGDLPALNRLANYYKVNTGDSAPQVFNSVKTALTGEIAKAFTGAGATVSEVAAISDDINNASSPQQLKDVLTSYGHLLDTKGGNLRSQFDAARQGRPNFGGPAPTSGPKAGDVEGGYRFKGGNPSDQKNWVKQ